MGMHLKTRLVLGVKRTRKEWEEAGVDSETVEQKSAQTGISYISSEGCEHVIVGKIIAESDEYSDQKIEEIPKVNEFETWISLDEAGINCSYADVRLYLMGCWG